LERCLFGKDSPLGARNSYHILDRMALARQPPRQRGTWANDGECAGIGIK
jgi:hypothetical protein